MNQVGQDEPRSEQERKMMQMFKFGRRVVFDKQLSNKEVLQSHLNSMHEINCQKRALRDSAIKDEREYIDKRKAQDDMREAEK